MANCFLNIFSSHLSERFDFGGALAGAKSLVFSWKNFSAESADGQLPLEQLNRRSSKIESRSVFTSFGVYRVLAALIFFWLIF